MTDNISKREDYYLPHLEVVDTNFSTALYTYVAKYGDEITANEIKYVAITYYIYAWNEHFKSFKDDAILGSALGKVEFPPTFDKIVDEYIEKVKGYRPAFSYQWVIDAYEPKINPLGLFR